MLEALLLSFVVTFATWFIIQRKRRLSFFKDLGIPGPPPSFLSGNLSELIQKGTLVKYKEWLDKYGDIVGFYNGAHPFLIVKDPELIKKIQIKDFHNFHSRGISSGLALSHPINKYSIVIAQGERWKKIRSLVTPAFTTSNMKKMASLMDDSSNEFLQVLESLQRKGEALEFRELFQRLTADVIIRSAFGLKSDLQQKDRKKSTIESLFRETLDSLQQFRRTWINFLTTCFPEFTPLWRLTISFFSRHNKTAQDKSFDEITPIIQFRRENREDRCDLLQLMLNAEGEDAQLVNVHSLTAAGDADSASEGNQPEKVNEDGKKCVLTNTEILANGFGFFVAGFETTGSTMAFLSYLLAKHQDIQDRLREDVLAVLKRDGAFTYDNVFGIKYLDQVISESLRFYSPVVGFTTRRCARDYVHKGITIPAGTSIVIPNHHLSHDPNFWEQPEVFDPERFSPENKGHVDPVVYQPFGQGPRNCVGMRFAQLEMKLTMAKLLSKYKLLLDDRHIKEKDLELESTFVLAMPKDGIWLKVENVV
ncbi:LOW QUALITY PROTEIN: cytochrome P450 3A8-like [Rhipicephalus sanguineus]|uniref:LOW QUALITY PROTEIN: cytochrome P450 3A8-like n=1 Tax=Rhipicephalus sanguineus TaxID=34632 RepID=UPI0020C4A185|nr:LOW QUALITY PROTEIN: cytochrome P450 3A8-like [Rhipicephalus sanguineus]